MRKESPMMPIVVARARPVLDAVLLLLLLFSVGCASLQSADDPTHGSNERWEVDDEGGRGLESRDGDWRHSLKRGNELSVEHRDVDAMLYLLRAHIESGGNTETRSSIAWLQLRHDYRVSVALFLNLVRDDPDDATSWHGLGLAQLRLGEFEKAKDALERSLKLAPEKSETLIALSSVSASLGDFDAAVDFASRASEVDPGSGEALNALGYSLMLRGDLERAESALAQALETNPNNTTFLNNLGVCFVLLDRRSEALELFTRSGEKQSAYNNLGFLLVGQGDSVAGVSILERALVGGGDADDIVLENLRRAVDVSDTQRE